MAMIDSLKFLKVDAHSEMSFFTLDLKSSDSWSPKFSLQISSMKVARRGRFDLDYGFHSHLIDIIESISDQGD